MMPAIVTSIWSILQLALVMASRIWTLTHNMIRGCWMVRWGRWSRRQQSDGYQSDWRCITERYCWSRKTWGLESYHLVGECSGQLVISSAKFKMVWKSQLNNLTTSNSHTDPFKCFQMVPDRLTARQWAFRCFETTSPVLFNVLEVVKQNTRIFWRMYGCLRNVTKSNC
jgi:hypothetical protein